MELDRRMLESYKKTVDFKIIEPKSFITTVAEDSSGNGKVFIRNLGNKFIVTIKCDYNWKWSYMFKDSGLFGYSEGDSCMENNTFETLEAAYECFCKFYR